MTGRERPASFRVIIAGGGIAGLTLANALQHAGVDYILLESRRDIAPQVGASIGLAPNGSRILDQLSCYDEIEKCTEPVELAGMHAANGDDLLPRSDGFQLVQARTNYGVCFVDRQIVLQVLADHILDKRKIQLNKRLFKVDHLADGVTVCCTDGTSYDGDIIVGADGVFSKVRQEMWRFADAVEPGGISQNEQNSMIAEYKCLFGISSPTSSLPIGNYDVTFDKDVSTMTITGKGGRVFWFVFGRMSHTYRAGRIPHFTKADAEVFAQQNLDIPILPQGLVRFGDIWKNRVTYNLVALEEADYDHWTWGRFACLGDSIHKMTPNMGSGGMAVVESAAALANSLQALSARNDGNHPSLEEIRGALTGYQQTRKLRASETVKVANDLTRIQALKGIRERIVAHHVLPNAGDLLVDMSCDGWIGATLLNYLPPPARSLKSSMPFNPEQGIGNYESKVFRAMVALPFLVMAVWCFRIIAILIPWESGAEILTSGKIEWGESFMVTIPDKFYHVKVLDDLCRGAALTFAPSTMGYDPVSSVQMFTFFADIGLVYSILLVESSRRANMLTAARFPIIFGMGAFFGIGAVMPFYYFLHYITTPIANHKAADMRLTDLSHTRSILPVMALGYYTPYFLSYFAPDLASRHAAMWVWHLFPLWVAIGQWLLARTVMPSTIQYDRLHNVTRDLWPIRMTVGTLAVLSGVVYHSTIFSTPFSLGTIILPSGDGLNTFVGAIRELLKYDQLFFAGSSVLWIIYLFSDLKKAGMVQQNWFDILCVLITVTLLFGSGAATAVGWLWREEVLATRRHKGAVVNGWEGKGLRNGLGKRVHWGTES